MRLCLGRGMPNRDHVTFYLNGEKVNVSGDGCFLTGAEFLRTRRGLTGTKIVCAEGDCGACTVLVSHPVALQNGQLDFIPINACIQFVFQFDGLHVISIEGLTHGETSLHPIQQAFVTYHGAQCGYCTPGLVCALAGLFEHKDQVNARQVKNALTGNLCRCTGYDPIITAALSVETKQLKKLKDAYGDKTHVKELQEIRKAAVKMITPSRTVYSPTRLEDALIFMAQGLDVTIVSGATDVGVVTNKGRLEPKYFLNVNLIPEFYTVGKTQDSLSLGAKVNLTDTQRFVADRFPEFARLLNIFASVQIKNAATLVGNIANGSPIGDTLPFLFVAEAYVEIASLRGRRSVNINDLYTGYRRLALEADEIITAVKIPTLAKGGILKLYKVSKRKDLDISAFTAAILMTRHNGHIVHAKVAYGGVAPTVMRMKKLEDHLCGKKFSLDTFVQAGKVAREEIAPISDVRGTKEYRRLLAENILQKFFYESESV